MQAGIHILIHCRVHACIHAGRRNKCRNLVLYIHAWLQMCIHATVQTKALLAPSFKHVSMFTYVCCMFVSPFVYLFVCLPAPLAIRPRLRQVSARAAGQPLQAMSVGSVGCDCHCLPWSSPSLSSGLVWSRQYYHDGAKSRYWWSIN